MKYKMAIFDLDGTLLDTLEDLADSVNYALQTNGLVQRTIEEVRRFVGNGIRNLIDRAVPDGTDEEMTAKVFSDFKEYYALHCADKTAPYEGVLDVLKKLREQGIRTAVVSNKGDFAVQSLCRDYFPGLLDFAVGEREGIRRKPSPDSVMECLKAFDLKVEEAVYIGDSEVDVQTAANAKMDLVIVTWGFREEEELREAGAKTFVYTMEELENCLM